MEKLRHDSFELHNSMLLFVEHATKLLKIRFLNTKNVCIYFCRKIQFMPGFFFRTLIFSFDFFLTITSMLNWSLVSALMKKNQIFSPSIMFLKKNKVQKKVFVKERNIFSL